MLPSGVECFLTVWRGGQARDPSADDPWEPQETILLPIVPRVGDYLDLQQQTTEEPSVVLVTKVTLVEWNNALTETVSAHVETVEVCGHCYSDGHATDGHAT